MSNGDADIRICQRQKVALNEQIDRISSLPDHILVHILSLLPTQDAIKTVLIRRFGNLWTYIDKLDFDACLSHECSEAGNEIFEVCPVDEARFINLVRHALILHQRSDIHRFRLKFELELWYSTGRLELCNDIDTWIRFALRKEVKVLELDFKACGISPTGYHKLLNVVLISDFLTQLKLVSCRVEPQEHIQLLSLKSLSLDGVVISDKTLIGIISGCPVLESLFIHKCYTLHKLDFTSLNLKNVVIDLNCHDSSRLQVSCPYAKSLNITGIDRTTLYNVSSIVNVSLDFDTPSFDCARAEYREVKMLLEQLYDAEVLTLFNRTILVFTIWELMRRSYPSMNWRHLVLKTMLTKWHLPGIASLLRNTPDLKVLDIHIQPGANPFTYNSDDPWLKDYKIDGENFWDYQRSSFHCLRSHLKTIRIRKFEIKSCAVKLVHFLLRKACVLDKLVIEPNRDLYADEKALFTSETWKRFSEDIRSSPRASPQAVILIL